MSKRASHYMSAKYFDMWEVGGWIQWGIQTQEDGSIVQGELSKRIAKLVDLKAVEIDGHWHFAEITIRFEGDDRDVTFTPELVSTASICLPAVA